MDQQLGKVALRGPQDRLPVRSLGSGLPIVSLSARVRRRLPAFDAAEKAIPNEYCEFAMAWNHTLSVNRLPNELLVSIFAQVADDLSIGERQSDVGPPRPSTEWMKLILVCRYWRDVAYASPTLWRVIHMGSPAHTARALALSSPATIDVWFGFHKSNAENLQLLKPHAHRLRSLYFEVIPPSWTSFVAELLQGDGRMRALETLRLPFLWRASEGEEPEDGEFVDLQLSTERYPRLRSLNVVHAVVPRDVQMYCRLRRLSLNDCRCDISFDHFLDALEASTSLDILVLDSILERIEGDWTVGNAGTDRSPRSLRHLKSLVLINHPTALASRFLSCVLLSPTASVWVKCIVDFLQDEDFTDTVTAILPSNHSTVLPALAAAKDITVEVYGPRYLLSCSIEHCASSGGRIALQIEDDNPRHDWCRLSPYGARDLLNIFASAPLTTLNFTGSWVRAGPDTWAEIFSKYPLLETFNLARPNVIDVLFKGLKRAAPPPDAPVPCPNLRAVCVEGPYTFLEEDMDKMIQCFRDRAAKGYRLGRVQMELSCIEEDRELVETDYLPQLREVVSDVTCTFSIFDDYWPLHMDT